MAKKPNWNPKLIKQFEIVSDLKFAKTLAELGELIYKEIRSRQLLDQISLPIAASKLESHLKPTQSKGVADA